METLTQWITHQQQRRDRFVSVYEALLGKNPIQYLFYRLRFFIVITLIGLAAHIIEFSLLYVFLKKHSFLSIISFKVIFTLVNGTWWGTLEIMRERIRRYYRSKRTHEIGVEITLWISIGILVNLAVFAATLPISLPAFIDLARGKFSLFDTYILTILIQTFCMLIVKTMHSGCFAIKRVYRPLSSILLFEISSIFFILLFMPFLHAYSLPLGVFLSSLINVAVSIYYNMNMYRFLHIKPFQLPRLKHLVWRIRQLFSTELLYTSLSGLVMQLESVIVLILIFRSMHYSHLSHISVLIYFISPLIRASFDWVKLFYYDLKKFSHPLYRHMVALLNRYIERASYAIVIIFWLISFLLSISFHLYDLPILLALFPLYIFRSFLAHWQIHRFTEMRFFDIIISGLIVTVGLIITITYPMNVYYLLLTIILSMLLSLAYLYFIKTRPIETDTYHRGEVPFYQWLTRLRQQKKPACAYELVFSNTKPAQRSKSFINYMHDTISQHTVFARLDQKTVLFFEQALQRSTLERLHFFANQTAGTIVSEYSTRTCKDGPAAIKCLIQSGKLNLNPTSAINIEQQYSAVTTINLLEPNPQQLNQYSAIDCNDIFYQLEHFLKWPLKYIPGHAFYVSAEILDQCINRIHILPSRHFSKTDIMAWQIATHQRNLINYVK